MEQRTAEWFEAREGKRTASTFGEVVGLVGSRKRLWREITGREQRFVTQRMNDGTLYEPVVNTLYEALHGVTVEKVGFIVHPELDWIGGSPDGLVGPRGMVEYKCPETMYASWPEYYLPQVQALLEITDRDWCDCMAWTPAEHRIWRVYRSVEYWDALLEQLAAFQSFVDLDVEPPAFKRGMKPTLPVASVIIEERT